MKVWADSVYDTAIGKVAGQYDPVDNNQAQITISKKSARCVIGLLVLATQTVITDAENIPDIILRINSVSEGITNQDFVIPVGTNDGDANSGFVPTKPYYIPFIVKGDLHQADFDFAVAPAVASTGGFDVVVTLMYADSEPDQDFKMELLSRQYGAVRGGAHAEDNAKAMATALTTVNLTSISVKKGMSVLKGILGKTRPNGITAGDPVNAVFTFTSTAIDDFSPQIWCAVMGFHAALGTVADGLNGSGEGNYHPTRFDHTGEKADISVSVTPVTGQGTAPDTIQAVVYE
jgi:hypothetical protein